MFFIVLKSIGKKCLLKSPLYFENSDKHFTLIQLFLKCTKQVIESLMVNDVGLYKKLENGNYFLNAIFLFQKYAGN